MPLATNMEMLDEAEFRLVQLGIPQSNVWLFRNSREPPVCLPPLGDFCPAEPELIQLAQQCGREYDALVYLIVRSYDPMKEDAFLFVDRDMERWETCREFLENGMPRAIVHNYSSNDEYISTIGISHGEHGIIRVS